MDIFKSTGKVIHTYTIMLSYLYLHQTSPVWFTACFFSRFGRVTFSITGIINTLRVRYIIHIFNIYNKSLINHTYMYYFKINILPIYHSYIWLKDSNNNQIKFMVFFSIKNIQQTNIKGVACSIANMIFITTSKKYPVFEKILFYLHVGCLQNFSNSAQFFAIISSFPNILTWRV